MKLIDTDVPEEAPEMCEACSLEKSVHLIKVDDLVRRVCNECYDFIKENYH